MLILLAIGISGCHSSIRTPEGSPSSVVSTAGIVNGDTDSSYDAPSSSDGNLWESITKGFKLDHNSNRPEVQAQVKWFMNHQDYLNRVAIRATPYAYYILEQVKDRDMPTEIALLPIVESAYDPFLYSNAGAAGLWQFMPGTASGFKVRQDWWYDGRRDIYDSTNAALNYLLYLNDYFNNDWYLALAAYNSGEGTVKNAIRRNKVLGRPTDFWHLKLPQQTRAYVPKLLALATILDQPDKYPLDLPEIPDAPYLAAVTVPSQIDLQKAADYAGITTEEVYTLNPGYSKWATDPTGPHKLLIPVDKVEQFKEGMAAAPQEEQVSWKRYQIRQGDSLERIAQQHKTSTQLLEQLNSINRKVLQVGQAILIPIGSRSLPQQIISSVKHYLKADNNIPGQTQTTYIVRKGDTITRIAKKYGVKPQQIRGWNQIPPDATVSAGQQLTIWSKRKRVRGQYYASQIRPYMLTHTVAAGENLSDIANQYHVTTADLRSTNQLKSNTVTEGQVLTIPPSVRRLNVVDASKKSSTQATPTVKYYTVRSGDTLSKIARKYGTSVNNLRKLNDLSPADSIRIGQKLKV